MSDAAANLPHEQFMPLGEGLLQRFHDSTETSPAWIERFALAYGQRSGIRPASEEDGNADRIKCGEIADTGYAERM